MAKNKFKFELNRDGVHQLLTGPEIQGVLNKYARNAASAAGPGYKTSSYVGKNRANASVYADSDRAMRDNYKNNTILKSLK